MTFVNERSKLKIGRLWKFAIRYVVPGFLLVLLILNVITEFETPYEGYPAWALLYIGVLPLLIAPLIAYAVDKLTSKSK